MTDQLDISRYSENAAHHAAAKEPLLGGSERRLVRVVRQFQNDPEKPLASIRCLSKRFRIPQKEVLDACEDAGLNINVGVQCRNGIYVEKLIGDYTVEDLDGYVNAKGDPAAGSPTN